MSEAIVAKRYADALFQLGNKKNILTQLVEDFQVVQEVFENNQQIYTFLEHPRIENVRKQQFLEDSFKGLHRHAINTLKILVERHRIAIISQITENFIQMDNEAKGTTDAVVYSVRALTDTEKESLAKTFAKRIHKQAIKLENIVDPTMLGGIKLRIGNTIYDGSIKGKLGRLERKIVTVNK